MQSVLTLYVLLGCSMLMQSSQSVHITSPSVQQPNPAIRSDYTFTPWIGAHKLHLQPTTWNMARRSCDQEGGHLAIINSVAEAQVIVRLLNESASESAFVGIHDLFQEDEFLTIHGEPIARMGFNSWRAGQPSNWRGNEHCVAIYADGLLNDESCDKPTHFVCELPNVI